ncbi:MAG: hypothetical protein K6G52_07860 [Treponemataceae bacterium]|nr:hypothetical protein [Treponemataceae bacterium]
MKKRILFLVALVMAIFLCSSCAVTYNNLKDRTYALYANDECTSGVKWSFTSEKWPYVGDSGYILNIEAFVELSESDQEFIEAAAAMGITIELGEESSSSQGVWKPVSATEVYINCPGESQTKKTYTIEIDDEAGTLILTDGDGTVIMTRVTE